MGWLRKIFSTESMVPERLRVGELLPANEAYRNLMRLAVPSVLEMVLMALISMADTMMVSTMGTNAIAAVGLVTQPRLIMLCFFYALNTGITAIVARRRGEGNRDAANLTLRNAILVALVMIAGLMAITLPFSKQIIRMVGGVPGVTLEDGTTYFRIIALALPANALSMCICAAQRGVGNTKLTMYVNVISNAVNVLFNWLLINGIGPFPRWGVKGAAVATAIGLCVGLVLSVYSLFHTHRHTAFLRLSLHDKWRFDKSALMAISKVGKSALLEQLCIRGGFLIYAMIVANLGTNEYAAHIIGIQFLQLSFSFGDGVGVASTALVGQMLGKKRPDLAHMYGKIAQRFALILSIALAVVVVTCRAGLVNLFIYSDTANDRYVRELAMRVMIVVAAMQPFQTSAVVSTGALRGAGDTRYVAFSMILTVVGMRPLLSFGAVTLIGKTLELPELALIGAWCVALLDMITRMVLMLRRYNGGKWHAIKL